MENNKKPDDDSRWDKDATIGCLAIVIIAALVIGGIWFGVHRHNVKKAEAVKQEQIAKQKEQAQAKKEAQAQKEAQKKKEAQEKEEEEATKLPVINFTGKIDPSVANVGDKVVIAVTIENTDSKKTIQGIKLIFSDKSFISEGLTIVNIMNGGQQQGRSFIWSMEIPPKESRTFNIVCAATNAGNYETVISIIEADGLQSYRDQNGNEELNAKLVIVP